MRFRLTSRLLVAALIAVPSAHAAVVQDGSIGGFSGASVQPGNGFTYDIRASLGQRVGSNLFHSFDQFDIRVGESANFSGPAGINNIISRITGGESTIAGRVSSNISNASLYLINPNGFVLSNGAVVDVGGTFHLSTADFVEFSDGGRLFSSLSATSTLSTAAISSFGFLNGGNGQIAIDSGRAIPGEDRSSSHNLNVNSDFILLNNVDFSAQEIGVRMGDAAFGEILIDDSNIESTEGGIFFQGGNIVSVDSLVTASGRDSEIRVRSNSLTIQGEDRTSAFRSGELGASGGDIDIQARMITLDHNAALTTSSGAGRVGGDISLEADTVSINDNSQIALLAGNDSQAGDISIRATDVLIENNSSLNSSSKRAGATAGIINIQADNRFGLDTGSSLLAESENGGIGGSVFINANNILIKNGARVDVQAKGGGDADIVDLLATDNLTVSSGAIINASSSGQGNGGNIRFRGNAVVIDDVDIVGEAGGTGTGGNILFEANSVTLQNTATISVSSTSTGADAGDAGTVTIEATDTRLDDTEILLASRGAGEGGDLLISSANITLTDSFIAAEADRDGQAGIIQMQGTDITWADVRIDASIKGDGNGGDILLAADNISLTNPQINITAEGPGNAGSFTTTGNRLNMSGSGGINGSTIGSGEGADILLQSDNVILADVVISSSSRGEGIGGRIEINASDSVSINSARLNSETFGNGLGGDIIITSPELQLSGNAALNVDAQGAGDAGSITFTNKNTNLSDNSTLALAASGSGDGGVLAINSDTVSLRNQASISGDVSRQANGGDLQITAKTISLSDMAGISSNTRGEGFGGRIGLTATDIEITDKATITAETLAPGSGEAGIIDVQTSNFTMAGGGLITNTTSRGRGGIAQINAAVVDISNGANIKSDSLAEGDGGDIDINASESFRLSGAGIDAVTRGSGEGGFIDIRAPGVRLSNNATLNISALSGSGDAGLLILEANDLLVEDSTIATATFTGGNAGVVTLTADNTELTNSMIQGSTSGAGAGADITLRSTITNVFNSVINSSTTGPGPGGVIQIAATDLDINGSSVASETRGDGEAGEIDIDATGLTLRGRGNLNGRARGGSGDAGDITINAGSFVIDEGLITLVTETSGTGGDLVITTGNLDFSRAQVTASAIGDGNAGVLTITADTGTLRDNATLSSDTTGNGQGGDIKFQADSLDILSGARVSSSATGLSDAGDVTLLVPNTLQIVNGAVQTTSAQSGGGSIEIQTEQRIRIDNGVVSASANGVTADSGGGNVTIDPELFTIRQSQIVAQANAGTGGNINLVANNFIADAESLISASSQRGIDGTVEIESPNQAVNPVDVDLNTGFQNLPEFISSNCNPNADRSYLIVRNLHPVRRSPTAYLPPAILGNSKAIPLSALTQAQSGQSLKLPGC